MSSKMVLEDQLLHNLIKRCNSLIMHDCILKILDYVVAREPMLELFNFNFNE
jgi:hypothetical protein